MIRSALIAFWACVVALGANVAYGRVVAAMATHAAPNTAKLALEVRKLKEINIPAIKDGEIKGYVVVQVSYTADAEKAKALGFSPDAFVSDGLFSHIYDDRSIDFGDLKHYDIKKMVAEVIERTNKRLATEVVKDVAVQEFTFMRQTEEKKTP